MRRGDRAAFLTAVLVLAGLTALGDASSANGCALTYKKHVDDKPHFFLLTNGVPGLCSVQQHDAANWTHNYHADHKYFEDIQPETVIGGLNYDARNATLLYWAKAANVDHSRLYRVRANDSHWDAILDQDDDFREMSYDWVAKNLYIIMGVRSLMVAVNVEHGWNPSVVLYDRHQLTSLAVHPNAGYLFFVETSYWYGVRSKICRAQLDGGGVIEFNRTGVDARYYVTGLVLDLHGDRLYWSVPGLDMIQSSNLDGLDVRTIGEVRVHSGQLDLSSRTLAVDRHYVYYRSAEANAVRRLEKASLTKDADFELRSENDAATITEILAFTHKSQKVRREHPCARARGGCEKYCFAVPAGEALRRVCKCSFDEVLAADGVTCVNKRQQSV